MQLIRNNSNAILGGVRLGRFGQFRIGRHQNIHPFLGHANVRNVFRDKYRCVIESTNCHDESFISIDFGEFFIGTVHSAYALVCIIGHFSAVFDHCRNVLTLNGSLPDPVYGLVISKRVERVRLLSTSFRRQNPFGTLYNG